MNNNPTTERSEVFDSLVKILMPQPLATMPLAAIWLHDYVQTSTDRKKRITEGDFIYVDENKQLQDCTDKLKANYRITGCYGKINNTDMYLTAIHVKTLELITVNL